jgi:hypothetical protein
MTALPWTGITIFDPDGHPEFYRYDSCVVAEQAEVETLAPDVIWGVRAVTDRRVAAPYQVNRCQRLTGRDNKCASDRQLQSAPRPTRAASRKQPRAAKWWAVADAPPGGHIERTII